MIMVPTISLPAGLLVWCHVVTKLLFLYDDDDGSRRTTKLRCVPDTKCKKRTFVKMTFPFFFQVIFFKGENVYIAHCYTAMMYYSACSFLQKNEGICFFIWHCEKIVATRFDCSSSCCVLCAFLTRKKKWEEKKIRRKLKVIGWQMDVIMVNRIPSRCLSARWQFSTLSLSSYYWNNKK